MIDLLVGEARLHLSVLWLGGRYTMLKEIQGARVTGYWKAQFALPIEDQYWQRLADYVIVRGVP